MRGVAPGCKARELRVAFHQPLIARLMWILQSDARRCRSKHLCRVASLVAAHLEAVQQLLLRDLHQSHAAVNGTDQSCGGCRACHSSAGLRVVRRSMLACKGAPPADGASVSLAAGDALCSAQAAMPCRHRSETLLSTAETLPLACSKGLRPSLMPALLITTCGLWSL